MTCDRKYRGGGGEIILTFAARSLTIAWRNGCPNYGLRSGTLCIIANVIHLVCWVIIHVSV